MQSHLGRRATIFVSVASFCDPLLVFTIRSALENARYPGRVSFGVVEQDSRSVEAELPSGAGRAAWLHVDPAHSRGACWARSLAMSLYAGEDYFFQIDSHTCFDPGWDSTLIETLEAISVRSGNPRTILSTRPFAFSFGPDGGLITKRFTPYTLKLVPVDPVLKPAEPVMFFTTENSGSMDDLPGFHISAANLFTRGAFVEEIPYDPFLYFHGEEQDVSIRAFTRGWDIRHPNKVPLYHLYKRREAGEPPLHGDPQFEEKRREKWPDMRRRAHGRLADLISGRLAGVYGIGAVRTIDDYLRFGGLRIEHGPAVSAASVPVAVEARR